MATTLPDSLLKIQDAYGESQWFQDYQDNWVRLNDTLLKYSALLDVDVTGLSTGDVLKWSTSSSMWEPYTPTHNPLGVGQSTTTTTTSTTTTTTVWLFEFTGEDYTIPPVLKKHWAVELPDGQPYHFGMYAGALQWQHMVEEPNSFSLWSRFKITGDQFLFYADMDMPEVNHPDSGNNLALTINLWNESKTDVVGIGVAVNYYNDYRRNFYVVDDTQPWASETGVTNSANAPMTLFQMMIYKGGSSFWAWYYKDGFWQWDSDAGGRRVQDTWFDGPIWIELHGERRQTGSGSRHDYRIRNFSVLRGTLTYPSTTTTTTTTTNTLTTTTQTVPLNDEGMDPIWTHSGITLSDNDKLATRITTGSWRSSRSKAYVMQNMPGVGNKFYFEVHCLDALSRYIPGLWTENTLNTGYGGHLDSSGFSLSYTGGFAYDGSSFSAGFGGVWEGPAILGVAIDIERVHLGRGQAWASFDGVWSSVYNDCSATTPPYMRANFWELKGTRFYAGCGCYYSSRTWRLMTREEDWTYSAPEGFAAMPSNDVV